MATQRQKSGGLGGLIFFAFVGAMVFAPAFAGVAVVGLIVWLVFASNAKFRIGQNPVLMKSGVRGAVEVAEATRSQVRSRSGGGPWHHTWTIALVAQPPGSAAFRVVVYRKIPERQTGPSRGQRYPAWFDRSAPQNFHVEWRGLPSVEDTAAARPEPVREQPRSPRPATQPSYQLPERDAPALPLAHADAGYGFDFAARGVDARARIEDVAQLEDGSTEMALTVTPRGARPSYRTVITTFVPEDRRSQVGKGGSLRLRVDPATPGRLMIVS